MLLSKLKSKHHCDIIYATFIMNVYYYYFWWLTHFLLMRNTYSKFEDRRGVSERNHMPTDVQFQTDEENNNGENPIIHDAFRGRHNDFKIVNRRPAYQEISDKSDLSEKRQCAIMYKDNEPIGILQPFDDSFKLLPVKSDKVVVEMNPGHQTSLLDFLYPAKFADDDVSEPGESNTADSQFLDEKYPSILTNFKIESRLERANLKEQETASNKGHLEKRELQKNKNEKKKESGSGSTKAPLKATTIQETKAVEEQLKDILDDMGLIDDIKLKDDQEKRELSKEDENLEEGLNKINMIKEDREKRAEYSSTTNLVSLSSQKVPITKSTTFATINYKELEEKLDLITKEATKIKREVIDVTKEDYVFEKYASSSTEKIGFDDKAPTSVDFESFNSRKKRQQFSESKKLSDDASENEDKSSVSYGATLEKIKEPQESKQSQYEKRVEREIKMKIENLKNEVKREMQLLKNNEEKKQSTIATGDEEPQRRKRQIPATLINEENDAINPTLNTDEKLKPLIRRRRHISFEQRNNLHKVHEDQLRHLSLSKNSSISFNSKVNTPASGDQNGRQTSRTPSPVKQNSQLKYREKISSLKISSKTTSTTKKNRISGIVSDHYNAHRPDDNYSRNKTIFSNENSKKHKKVNVNISNSDKEFSRGKQHNKLVITCNNCDYKNSSRMKKNNNLLKSLINKDINMINNTNNSKVLANLNSKNRTNHHENFLAYTNKIVQKRYTNTRKTLKQNKFSAENIADANLRVLVRRKRKVDVGMPISLNDENLDTVTHNCRNNNHNCHSVTNNSRNKSFQEQYKAILVRRKRNIDSKSSTSSPSANERSVRGTCNCGKNDQNCHCIPHNPEKTKTLVDTDGEDSDYEESKDIEKRFSEAEEENNDEQKLINRNNIRSIIRQKRKKYSNPFEKVRYLPVRIYTDPATGFDNLVMVNKDPVKRSATCKKNEYVIDMHPDIYRLTPIRGSRNSRRKRDNNLFAIDKDSPLMNQLAAIRSRSVPYPHQKTRRKRSRERVNQQPRQLIDMSEEDLFGALPQSFEGELARYKRVKRKKER